MGYTAAIRVLALVAAVVALPPPSRSRYGSIHRQKRSSEHIIRDCMHVTSEPGHYFFKSAGEDPTVCGVYLMTDPDKIIQLQFDYLDLPCGSGGLVSFVDGWELNGGFFPSESDHRLPLDDRVTEFCGKTRPSRAFLSSQNAAMVQYRVPKRSRGFSFKVTFLKNPTLLIPPTNVTSDISTEPSGQHNLEKRQGFPDDEEGRRFRPGLVARVADTECGGCAGYGGAQVFEEGATPDEEEEKKSKKKYETEETKALTTEELERIVLLEQLKATRLLKEYYQMQIGKAKREARVEPHWSAKLLTNGTAVTSLVQEEFY